MPIPAGTLATLRADFGGTIADFVVSNSGGAVRFASASLTMWDSHTGGARHTDLELGGVSVDTIPVGLDGEIPIFQGPPGVMHLWADGGRGRVLINSADYAADYAAAAGLSAAAAQEAAADAIAVGATNAAVAGFISVAGLSRDAVDARVAAFLADTRGVRPEGFNPTAGTGGDDSAAVQSCIDTGFPVLLTPGKTYLATGLVAKPGLYLTNGALLPGGTYRASLKTTSGDLFTTPSGGTVTCYGFRFANVALESAVGGGHLMRGMWSQGSFSNVAFVQNNNAKSIFDGTGLIDVSFGDECSMQHTVTSTVPAFKAVSSTGNLAQVDFGNTRCTNSGTWFFYIEGTSGTVPINFGFHNVNFEVCNGLVKMLSCRHFKFSRCGAWDYSTAATNHLYYIGKSPTSGAAPRAITFEDCIRDASTAPGGSVYDIYVDPAAGMTELNIDNCGHQTTGTFKVSAGNSTGRVRGYGVTTLDAGLTMDTDFWQDVSATATLGGSGTAIGNGAWAARMRRSGATIEYRLKFILGSSSTIGTSVIVNLPVAESGAGAGILGLRVFAIDAAVNFYSASGTLTSSTAVTLYTIGTGGVAGAVDTTHPHTWGTGDALEFGVEYEAAA